MHGQLQLFVIPKECVAHQALLFMEFSRQEYWSGLLFFFLQGVFLTQEFNPSLLHLLHWQADSLPLPYLLLNVSC